MTMETPTPMLTQAMIDALVDPQLLELYHQRWNQGTIAQEVYESWEAYGQALRAMGVFAPRDAGDARTAFVRLEEVASDLAHDAFAEGLKRGIVLRDMMQGAKPEDDRNAPALTPTEWYVSGKLLDSALGE
jgi:hypothetical protein